MPIEQELEGDDKAAAQLAANLLSVDIAMAEDWQDSKGRPSEFIHQTLDRWVAAHGAAQIDRRFSLAIGLTTRLDEFATAEEQEASREELYVLAEPDSAGYVVLGPTLRLLEAVHPRLPATFLDRFTGALNGWVRVYDYRDAQEHVEILREWADQDEYSGQYEMPNIEEALPGCLRSRRPLTAMGLRRVLRKIGDRIAKGILKGLMDLCDVAERASRPPISEEMGEQLMDRNPPLPALLAVFEQHDAIEACFDEEAQGMMEQIPEPNVILPFNGLDCSSVRETFDVLGVLCDTLACASRLIDMMPGNERASE